jgi:type II secretory pathway pseudopilin PulG
MGNSTYRLQRRFLTFMEMMVVLAIISLIGGVVAINVSKAMTDQRFRSEVAAVVNQLRLAQNLMLILDQDVSVKFTDDDPNKKIDYWLEMQCPAIRGWDKELTRRPPPLKTIRVVEFEADSNLPNGKEGELELKFMSGGTVMSRGILRLSTARDANQKGALERYVCLQGSPAPISSSMGEVPDVSCLEELNGEREAQMTHVTQQEINAKRQAAKEAAERRKASKDSKTPPPVPGQKP